MLMNNRYFIALGCSALMITGCGDHGSDAANKVTTDILDGLTYRACVSGSQITYEFDDGNATRTTETFAAADCSGSATTSVSDSLTYSSGSAIKDKDGNNVTKFNIVENNVTTFTIKHLSGGSLGFKDLQFGSTANSSPGKDGTSDANRHDGLDTVKYTIQ